MIQPRRHKTEGWPHQLDAYQFAFDRDAAMLALDMGCGKSWVAVNLICNWGCRSVLILCPKSVLNVWRREFEKHAAADCAVKVLDRGTVASKAKAAGMHLLRNTGRCAVVVCNYESAWRGEMATLTLGREWDCVVADESHRIKAHNSSVSKYAAKLKSGRKLALTGTPMPHSPLDLYGQMRFLDRDLYGSSWHRFRNTYAVFKQIPGITARIVSGYKNQDDLQGRLGRIAYRVRKDDVLKLPEVQHHERTCGLEPAARRVYDGLLNDLIAEIESGEVVTAANAMVRVIRLQQTTSGFAVDADTGAMVTIGRAKRDLLRDLLEDLPRREPVVVFCKFRHDLDVIREVSESLDRRCGEISGSRKDLTDSATMPQDIDTMAVQLQAGEVGIDLTRARYAVYYSTGCITPGAYEQSLARVHRPGQSRPVGYYHLTCENTVDQQAYRALAERRDIVEAVLGALKREPTEAMA